MKKKFSFAKASIAALCAAILVAAGIALYFLSPSFQTRMANDYLESAGGKVGELSAGFSSADASEISMRFGGGIFTAEKISLKYSLLPLLSGSVEISEIKVEGAKLKLSGSEKSIETKASGIEKLLENSNQTKIKIDTAKNSPKKTGGETETACQANKSELNLTLKIGRAASDIEVEFEDGSSVKAKLTAEGIETNSKLIPIKGFLKADTEISAAGVVEKLSLTARLDSKGKDKSDFKILAERASKKIFATEGMFSSDFSDIDCKAELNADDSCASGLGLKNIPTFSAKIYLEGKSKNFGSEFEALVKAKSAFENCEKISPRLKQLGKISFEADIDLSKGSDSLKVEKAQAAISHDGKTILSASSPKPFAIDLKNPKNTAGNGLFEIALNGLPPALISTFFDGLKFTGEDITGRLNLSAFETGDIKIATVSPILVSKFSAKKGELLLVSDLNSRIDISASANPDTGLKMDSKISVADFANKSFDVFLEAQRAPSGNISGSVKAKGDLRTPLSKAGAPLGLVEEGTTMDSSALFDLSGGAFTLKSAKIDAGNAKNPSILSVSVLKEISFENGEPKFQDGEILRLKLDKMPVAFLSPLVKGLRGKYISGTAEASNSGKIFYLNSELSADSLYFLDGEKYLLKNISPNAKISAEFDGKNLTVKLPSFRILEGPSELLFGKGEVFLSEKSNLSADIEASASLKSLSGQPALAKYLNIASGNAKIKLQAKKDSAGGNFEISNLTTPSSKGNIESLKGSFSAEFGDDAELFLKKLSAKANSASTKGYSEAQANVSTIGNSISLKAECESLVWEHIETLAFSFAPRSQEAEEYAQIASKASEQTKNNPLTAKKTIARPKRASKTEGLQNINASREPKQSEAISSKAFWDSGIDAKANVSVKKILKERKEFGKNLKAEVSLSKDKLELQELSGILMDGTLNASALLSFNPSSGLGYFLQNAKFSFKNFESSKIFSANSHVFIDGKFDVVADLNSKGESSEALIKNLKGNASVNGSGGTIRLLDKNSDAGQKTAMAGGLLKIAGAFLNNRVSETGGIAEMIDLLSELKYDSAEIRAERKTENIEITSCKLLSPDFILDADGGSISCDPSLPFSKNSLNISALLLIRNNGEKFELFRKAGFCERESSQFKGFYTGPRFVIGGIIDNPQTNLKEVLSKAGGSVLKGLFEKR